jgi:hypothetical protein
MPFALLPDKAAEHLASIGRRCVGVRPADHKEWIFNTASLGLGGMLPIVDEVEQWSGPGSYIYYFQCLGAPDLNLALDRFSACKLRDKGLRSYAKSNSPSMCLYVGGSKSIVSRLKQHLGYSAAKGTYSLQLLHWTSQLPLELTFACARYANATAGRAPGARGHIVGLQEANAGP